MAVNSVTSSAPTAGGLTALASPSATRDQFLKLFVAQLEHQNPLDPQSGADMVAQLAQLSSLEQQVQTNTSLTSILGAQDSQSSAQLAGLVGKNATVNASTVQLDGAPPPMSVKVDGAITGGSLVIKNANGDEIRRIPLPAGKGPFPIAWDGTGSNGAPVPPGSYSLSVECTGAGGTTVTGTPQITGTIDGVELGAAGTRLRIGHSLVNPADVLSIGATGATP